MAIHRHILWNGQITEAADACLKPGQVGLLSGWGVFSTFRVMNGALFAWERHWARMTRDAKLLNIAMPEDAGKVYQDVLRLLQANDVSVATVRLVVVRNGGGLWEGPGSGLESDTIALTAPMKKWGSSVRLGIQADGRYAASDFTRAKILSWAENLRWAERAQENGFDEVVLLNERGQVTECTSANIFAVFGSEVVTAPATDGCLPGITREVLLEEIHEALERRQTFALETTLSGKTYIRLFRRARQLGYEIELHYLWLSHPTQAIARVQQGGHHVPATDIRRRFRRSLLHLGDDYLALATRWAIWDSRDLPAKRLAISATHDIDSIRKLIGP